MGRLPDTFGRRKITTRIPQIISAHADMYFGQQGLTLRLEHNNDKPFEIHRLIPRAFVKADVTDTSSMYEITLDLLDVTRNQPLTKQPTLLAALVKGNVERTWEWGEPMYLERSEAFQATLGSVQPTPVSDGVISFVELVLEGFLVITGPANDRRG